MTFDEIKQLIELVDKSQLTELKYEVDKEKLTLSKKQDKVEVQTVAAMPAQAMMPAYGGGFYQGSAPAGMPAANAPAAPEAAKAADDSAVEVRSPYVGTILLNADDSNRPLVNVGDHVKKGQKLCQIEAMKMYNDVNAPADGKILSIEVDQGSIVECDQLLFKIEKG